MQWQAPSTFRPTHTRSARFRKSSLRGLLLHLAHTPIEWMIGSDGTVHARERTSCALSQNPRLGCRYCVFPAAFRWYTRYHRRIACSPPYLNTCRSPYTGISATVTRSVGLHRRLTVQSIAVFSLCEGAITTRNRQPLTTPLLLGPSHPSDRGF